MTRYFELLREPMQTVKIRNSAGGSVVYCEFDARDAPQNRTGKRQRYKLPIARFHRTISVIVVRATSATPAYEKPSQLVGALRIRRSRSMPGGVPRASEGE